MTNNPTPQPAGEGGAREATRRILGLREGKYCYARTCFARLGHRSCSGCEDFDAIVERVALELSARATQPAAAPSDAIQRARVIRFPFPCGCLDKHSARDVTVEEFTCETHQAIAAAIATPTDVEERIRRAAEKVTEQVNSYTRAEGFEVSVDEFLDIIAAEFK